MKAKLHLKSGATPKFVKAQPVPFALRPKVEVSLKKLKQEGMLEKVTHSEWGSRIINVPKKTRGMRICENYKVTHTRTHAQRHTHIHTLSNAHTCALSLSLSLTHTHTHTHISYVLHI